MNGFWVAVKILVNTLMRIWYKLLRSISGGTGM
ncbi:hypothetical protein J2W47_005328 [Priestia megaterium]|nr:hypothetical protein [Priestia megaterium]